MSERKAFIKNVDMCEDMQHYAVECATQVWHVLGDAGYPLPNDLREVD